MSSHNGYHAPAPPVPTQNSYPAAPVSNSGNTIPGGNFPPRMPGMHPSQQPSGSVNPPMPGFAPMNQQRFPPAMGMNSAGINSAMIGNNINRSSPTPTPMHKSPFPPMPAQMPTNSLPQQQSNYNGSSINSPMTNGAGAPPPMNFPPSINKIPSNLPPMGQQQNLPPGMPPAPGGLPPMPTGPPGGQVWDFFMIIFWSFFSRMFFLCIREEFTIIMAYPLLRFVASSPSRVS